MSVTRKTFLYVLIVIVLSSAASVFAFTEDEAQSFAHQAYTKALETKADNDIELASMYFMNALSFSPGNIEIISDYVSMILARASEDTTLLYDTFEALDSFLNAQIMTVKPDDLPKILELRAKLSEEHSKFLSRDIPLYGTDNLAEFEVQLKQYKARVLKSKTFSDYLNNLRMAQQVLDDSGLTDSDISDNLQICLMMDATIAQINTLLERTENSKLWSAYYLQLAEASFQQVLALSVKLPYVISEECLAIRSKIDSRINKLSEERSSAAMSKIRSRYTALNKIISNGTNQSNINELNNFMQYLTVATHEITSEKHNNELQKIIEDVQNLLLNYRIKQEKQYNVWAVHQLDMMMREAEKHDRTLYKGKLRDSAKMREVMVERLSPIDTRLLNFGAQHVFSKVYEEYYAKLDAEDQKKLDEAMAYNDKRNLPDF